MRKFNKQKSNKSNIINKQKYDNADIINKISIKPKKFNK